MYADSPVEVSKEPDLLDGWWTSQFVYSLERRAIFSKTWVCIAHRSRFIKPGDYISLELAGFPILIILGKDYIVRAFHNVCRHRAYTVTKKPAGSSLVLGCRYHGWSYDTKGSLVKAPHFDGIEGFNRSENGLFKIHTCTDRAGFIHTNLDAGQLEHAPDCEQTLGFAFEHRISASSKWMTSWELGGAFNWKTVGAGDPSVAATQPSIVQCFLSLLRSAPLNVDARQNAHAAPVATIKVIPNSPIWVMLVALPVSATECRVKCDVFSTNEETTLNNADTEALKEHLSSIVHALEQHHDSLKDSRPHKETVELGLLKAHLKLERLAGAEFYPGRREYGRSETSCRAEKVCKDLDALARAGKAWGHAADAKRVDSLQRGLEW